MKRKHRNKPGEPIVSREKGEHFYCLECSKEYRKCKCRVYVSADTLRRDMSAFPARQMNEPELRRIFPKASQSFLNQNAAIMTVLNDKNETERPQKLRKLLKCRGMTNTELEFRSMLRRQFPDCDIRFESYKLRIADRCHYCPDFAVIHLSGLIDFYECKGAHIWEDSKIKWKAAKEMYPHHKFEMWQYKKGLWQQIL